MSVVAETTPDEQGAVERAPPSSAVEHVRGSSLLLVGRVFALALGFGSQVLIVRYLSKTDFGAFSYALSVVALLQGFAMLEMPSAVSRFLPIYREHRQYGALFGAIAVSVGVVAGFGTLVALAIIGGVTLLGFRPTTDPQALQLLTLLALLIPIQGIDSLFNNLFAAFGSSRSILLRQSVLAPGLRLIVVLGLIGLKADVFFLTVGYLLIAVLGVALYAVMFVRLLRAQDMLKEFRIAPRVYPARALFSFAIPLLGSTLVWSLMESSDGVLLGYFRNTQAVADFRAVLPLAQMNLLVSTTFATLYMPAAARLHARNDQAGLSDLYWQTALWMVALSFPIYVITFSFARSVTTALYGAAYTEAAPVLGLLALGYFFQTALGFNGLTLKVLNKLRYVVAIDVTAAILNLLINVLLIPQWGVLGAAAGTAGTMIIHNLFKQFGLWKYAGVTLFHRKYAAIYAVVFGLPPALLGLQAALPASLWVALPLGAAASLLVLWISRGALQVATAFPELRRWAVFRFLAGPGVKPS